MEHLSKLINYMCPYVRRAWDGVMPVNWYLAERIIFDFEILYIMEGQAEITVEDIKYQANPGDMFFLRPLKRHSIRSSNNTNLRQPHVHFDFFYQEDSEEVYIPYWPLKELGDDVKYARIDISGSSFFNIPDKIILKNPAIFEELMFKIIRNNNNTASYSILNGKAYLLELIACVFNESAEIRDDSDVDDMQIDNFQIERMEVSRNYIMKNYNTDLTLDQIAKEAGFSKNYFTKLFKHLYNMTPVQYHTNLRIERAKHLLVFTDGPITHISESLGFETIHIFSRAFKNITGVSPTYYRKINHE